MSALRLTDEMKRAVTDQGLAFVASVRPDGTPAVSPKGTTSVWGDSSLVFLHLYSPGTVHNVELNPAVEVNVVDPIARTGWRFSGLARVLTEGAEYDAIMDFFAQTRPASAAKSRAAVIIDVTAAERLVSPAYETSSEDEIVSRWLAHHAALHAGTGDD